MITDVVSISAANWIPLSAAYEPDPNIVFPATLNQWSDGYSTYSQAILSGGQDTAVNKSTILYLPDAKNLLSFLADNTQNVDIGAYVNFSFITPYEQRCYKITGFTFGVIDFTGVYRYAGMENGYPRYTLAGGYSMQVAYNGHWDIAFNGIPLFENSTVTNTDVPPIDNWTLLYSGTVGTVNRCNCITGTIILDSDTQYIATSGTQLITRETLTDNSLYRVIANNDGSFSIIQQNELYITVSSTNPFNLTLEKELVSDQLDRQKFYFYTPDNIHLYIITKTLNRSSGSPPVEERFWSYSKAGPSKGLVRANGVIGQNSYLINVTGFAIAFELTGLIKGHDWVRYFNLYEDSLHNKDVDIDTARSAEDVKISHLVTTPYNTKIDTESGSFKVNITNLKNIYTDKYNNNVLPLPEVSNKYSGIDPIIVES